ARDLATHYLPGDDFMQHPTHPAHMPCPRWCSPLLCTSQDHGVEHVSAPLAGTHGDERWAANLIQVVEFGDPGGVLVRITVTDTAFPAYRADHLFPLEAVPGLIAQLTDLHHQARSLASPAVADETARAA
ncbi:MAG: hypothetical protein ACRDQX_10960, partial [Pseudonocardiaceae bacterium]